jgi:hypothetical protein
MSARVGDRTCPNVLELFCLKILYENGLFRLKRQHLERQAQELCRLLVAVYTSYRVQRDGLVNDCFGCTRRQSSVYEVGG